MFNWMKKLFAPIEPEIVTEVGTEEPVPTHTSESLAKLTKLQLEELGRTVGVELDRRKKKATLIEELLDVL